jgi:hypothetical protein
MREPILSGVCVAYDLFNDVIFAPFIILEIVLQKLWEGLK